MFLDTDNIGVEYQQTLTKLGFGQDHKKLKKTVFRHMGNFEVQPARTDHKAASRGGAREGGV